MLNQVVEALAKAVEENGVQVDVVEEVLVHGHLVFFKLHLAFGIPQVDHGV